MGLFRWLKKRELRRLEQQSVALLREIEKQDGGHYLFDTCRTRCEDMVIFKGWVRREPGYERRNANGPSPYQLTDKGRARMAEDDA